MSFTYGTLKTAIQDYLEVSETTFTDQLPTFIQEAEDRIFSFVQLPEQRKNVQGTVTTGNRFLATPTDFYTPMSLATISSDTYDYLDFKHPSFIKEYSSGTTRSKPKYYSLFDDTAFEVSPIPDADYTVELHYLHKPVSLTAGSDSGTTFLSTDYSDALLYGSLVEGAIFLKEASDVIMQLEGRFKAAVARMENTSEGRGTRDEYRDSSVRASVS